MTAAESEDDRAGDGCAEGERPHEVPDIHRVVAVLRSDGRHLAAQRAHKQEEDRRARDDYAHNTGLEVLAHGMWNRIAYLRLQEVARGLQRPGSKNEHCEGGKRHRIRQERGGISKAKHDGTPGNCAEHARAVHENALHRTNSLALRRRCRQLDQVVCDGRGNTGWHRRDECEREDHRHRCEPRVGQQRKRKHDNGLNSEQDGTRDARAVVVHPDAADRTARNLRGHGEYGEHPHVHGASRGLIDQIGGRHQRDACPDGHEDAGDHQLLERPRVQRFPGGDGPHGDVPRHQYRRRGAATRVSYRGWSYQCASPGEGKDTGGMAAR